MRVRNRWLIASLVVVLAVGAGFGLLFLFLNHLGKQARIRIVRSGTESGVLMAIDVDGLRQLNELYSLPKTCSEANLMVTLDKSGRIAAPTGSAMLMQMQLCQPRQTPFASQMINKGVVLIPEGTKAMYLEERFILPGGRLVEPYAANTFDMARDGAVEVEKIRITQPPNKDLEGWVEIHFLGRVCCGL